MGFRLKSSEKIIIFIALLFVLVGSFWTVAKFNFFGKKSQNPLSVSSTSINSSVPDNATLPNSPNAAPPEAAPQNTKPPAIVSSTPKSILLKVPFFAQAPFGEWSDPIFQNACEEASIIMAMHWVNKTDVTKEEAKQEILALTEFEDRTYGPALDRAATDAIKMFKDYYNYENVFVRSGISTKDIKKEILAGHLVIVPVNGQILKNPFYTPPGPDHHTLVIIGYDDKTNEFITNDVGTRQGQSYKYSESRLQASLQAYPTGNDLPSIPGQTAMIVVLPKSG